MGLKIGSHHWWIFHAGFLWSFACGALLTMGTFAIFGLFDMEKSPPPADCSRLVPMEEYRQIVRSLDRCNWRLNDEQEDNFNMKDEVDHWSYISRLVNSADPDTECMLLIAKATRDFLWEAEDDLYRCQEIRNRECWCPWEE